MRIVAAAVLASTLSWSDAQTFGFQDTVQSRGPALYSASRGSKPVHLRLTARIPIAARPNSMMLTRDGRELYLSDNSIRQIRVLDLRLRTITHLLAISPDATGMTIAPDGSRIYVGHLGGVLTAIDTASKATKTLQIR